MGQQPPRGRSLSLNPSRPQKTPTHCGRCPWVPGCLRTPSSRCGSCPGSSSVLDAGTSGPEGVRRGLPEAAGYPGSCPPGRGSCGRAGHRLEGKYHGQGHVACFNRTAHAVPACTGQEAGCSMETSPGSAHSPTQWAACTSHPHWDLKGSTTACHWVLQPLTLWVIQAQVGIPVITHTCNRGHLWENAPKHQLRSWGDH